MKMNGVKSWSIAAGRRTLGTLGIVGLLTLSGCVGKPDVQYGPATAASVVAKTNVGLTVSDKRPQDKGGGAAQIGHMRNGFGIPFSLDDKKADVVVKTVTDATTDALRKATVGVRAGGNMTLVASVKEFWFDGYGGYSATVTVSYKLTDASGKALWTADVKGKAGDTALFSNDREVAESLFKRALANLATHAGEQFNTPVFQQALAEAGSATAGVQ